MLEVSRSRQTATGALPVVFEGERIPGEPVSPELVLVCPVLAPAVPTAPRWAPRRAEPARPPEPAAAAEVVEPAPTPAGIARTGRRVRTLAFAVPTLLLLGFLLVPPETPARPVLVDEAGPSAAAPLTLSATARPEGVLLTWALPAGTKLDFVTIERDGQFVYRGGGTTFLDRFASPGAAHRYTVAANFAAPPQDVSVRLSAPG